MFLIAAPAALLAAGVAVLATTNKVSTAVRGLFRAPQPRVTKPALPPVKVVQLGGAAQSPPQASRPAVASGPVAALLQLLEPSDALPAAEPIFTTLPVRAPKPAPVLSILPAREPEPSPKPAPPPVRIAEQKPPSPIFQMYQAAQEYLPTFAPGMKLEEY